MALPTPKDDQFGKPPEPKVPEPKAEKKDPGSALEAILFEWNPTGPDIKGVVAKVEELYGKK